MPLYTFFIYIVVILLVDYVWLTVNKSRYNFLVKKVQGSNLQINIIGAILSYICVIISLIFFAIPKVKEQTLKNKSTKNLIIQSIIWGGGLGFIIYGIFNFTNIAIFKDYDIKVATMDTLWGFTLYTFATFFFLYPIN